MVTDVPIVLSVVAVMFSIYVFIDSHKRDRRDVLLKMHELLISDDLQRGRYLLFEKVTDEASVQHLSDQEYRDINRAIAAYNLLGIYVKNGYVKERDVMDAWDLAINRAWIAAQPFLAHREQSHGYRPAVYFEKLAKKAREELLRRGSLPEYVVWRRSPDVE